MKKLLCSLTLMLVMVTAFGQTLTREEYLLKKSKRQKTTSFILAGAGVLMMTSGILVWRYGDSVTGFDNGVSLIGLGALTGAISLPFALSSHINERKAAKLSVSYQHLSIPQNNGQAFHRQPTLTLSIPIK